MPSLNITLTQAEKDALDCVSVVNKRLAKSQAAILIRDSLVASGYAEIKNGLLVLTEKAIELLKHRNQYGGWHL